MSPTMLREARDQYWEGLAKRFRRVPVEWFIRDGRARGPRMKHGSSLLSLTFSADGKRILGAGGGRIPGCDCSIRIWDTATGKELLTCHAHICGLYELAIDARTGILASASEDYSVLLWNLEQRDVIALVGGPPIVKGSVAFASTRGLIAIGESEAFENRLSSVFVIDLDRGEEVFRQTLKHDESISALAISPTGDRLITAVRDFHDGNDTDVSCWTLKDGKREWNTVFRAACFQELRLLPDRKRLVAAVMSDEESYTLSGIYLLEADSGELVSRRLFPGIGSSVGVGTSGQIAAAYGNGIVEVLDGETLMPIKALAREKKGRSWCSIAVSPDGKLVIVGDAHGKVHRFNPKAKGYPPPPAFEPAPPAALTAAEPPALIDLLHAAKQAPDDDAPRRAIADWLGQAGSPKGGFVRLQCERAALPAGDRKARGLERRLQHLQEAHETEWVGPLPQIADFYRFRRGMMEVAFKGTKLFSKATVAWMDSTGAAWADDLTVYDPTAADITRLAKHPFLGHLNGLHLSGKHVGKAFRALLASPHLEQLTTLDVVAGGLTARDARLLVNTPLFPRLKVLELNANKIGDAGLEALVSSARIAGLRSLEVGHNEATEAGIRALASSPHIAGLKVLNVSGTYLLNAGVTLLANSPHLANLRSLSLSFTAVGSEGALALARSPYLKKLESLDLTCNGLDNKPGAAALRRRFGERVQL